MENKYRSLDDLPVTLRVEELMPILGIGRNTAYELVRSGRLRSIRVGRQVRIPKNALIEFLEDTEKYKLCISAAQGVSYCLGMSCAAERRIYVAQEIIKPPR